jgi:hypothetical protein
MIKNLTENQIRQIIDYLTEGNSVEDLCIQIIERLTDDERKEILSDIENQPTEED